MKTVAKRKFDNKTFGFEVTARDPKTHARAGLMTTAHGVVETPVFMPVGTQGTVKALTPRDLQEAGAEIILGNTYHLYIRPGIDIIQKFGSLHRFMAWEGPILTDSGGFQVFSLSRLREISEEGARFHSYFDGKEIFLTPEKVIEIQEAIASDIAMIFDECPPATQDKKRIRHSLELTLRWSERARKHHKRPDQALFGIIQGGIFNDLRKESLERTVEMDFDGYALGGLCVGELKDQMLDVISTVTPKMPEDKPRYLMGIGTPVDFLDSIEQGADLFDCVNPTRYGRNGTAFTRGGLRVVRNGKYQKDEKPIEEGCTCYTCRHFSRAYLRHLLNAEEMLGPQLVSIHNVTFFVQFVRSIRQAIREGRFLKFKKDFLNNFSFESR
ncbi:MAG: tRNA guanosine(34) transglycosylase Tgt [Candidatus Omnitrophica bacterium]|nr:tRNA guanosine(34) transglycosylase Tgt [Candidatus Omnitrophota bacterium]